jgi:hypothetical protein
MGLSLLISELDPSLPEDICLSIESATGTGPWKLKLLNISRQVRSAAASPS